MKTIVILFVINAVFTNIIICVINTFSDPLPCNTNSRYTPAKIDPIHLILNRSIKKLKDHYWFAESFVVKPIFLLHVFCNDMAALTERVHFYGDIFILKNIQSQKNQKIL